MNWRIKKPSFGQANVLIFSLFLLTIVLLSFPKAYANIPDKVAILYDQPLKTDDINEVLQKFKKGDDTDTIFHAPTKAGQSAWIYIPGEVLKKDTTRNFILTGFYDFTDLYQKKGNHWIKIASGGYYMKFSDESPVASRVSFRLFKNSKDIADAYLVACRRNNDYSPSIMEARLVNQSDILQWDRKHLDTKIWYNRITLIFWGILFLNIINFASRTIFLKSKGYLLFTIGNILITINFLIVFFVEPSNITYYPFNDPVLAVALADPSMIIGIGTLLFSIKYFYTGNDFKFISKILPKISFGLCFIFAIILFGLKYYYHLFYIANAITYVFLTLLITIIYLIIFLNRKFINDTSLSSKFMVFFIGSLFFAFFSIVGFTLALIFEQNTDYIGLFYLLTLPLVLGVSMYNIFVLIALNNQDFKEIKETITLKEKAYQLEIKVMQNSLNPHFIFNSLNLIDYFIYKEKLPEARKALYQFSDLLRTVIDKTSQSKILLSEELKIIKLYLEIERSRKTDLFNYSIQISEEIDTNNIFLPSLIIQPIVENAIKHGILNREEEEEGQIDIIVSKQEEFLRIDIKDNGIGFEKSKELHTLSIKENDHFGLELTRKRLELFSKQSKLEILSLKEGGSRVSLLIPL